jgi:hypothetical protein
MPARTRLRTAVPGSRAGCGPGCQPPYRPSAKSRRITGWVRPDGGTRAGSSHRAPFGQRRCDRVARRGARPARVKGNSRPCRFFVVPGSRRTRPAQALGILGRGVRGGAIALCDTRWTFAPPNSVSKLRQCGCAVVTAVDVWRLLSKSRSLHHMPSTCAEFSSLAIGWGASNPSITTCACPSSCPPRSRCRQVPSRNSRSRSGKCILRRS